MSVDLYKEEYCDLVIELGREGKTKTQMAAAIGVTRDTLYNWADRLPQFDEALTRATQNAQDWWEQLLQQQATGQSEGNATAMIFGMKNQFPDQYRERKETKLTGEVGIFEHVIDMTGYDEDDDGDSQEG